MATDKDATASETPAEEPANGVATDKDATAPETASEEPANTTTVGPLAPLVAATQSGKFITGSSYTSGIDRGRDC